MDGNNRPLLLIQQANYLRDNPTNFGGAYVRRQNQQQGTEAGDKNGTRAEEAMYERRSTKPNSAMLRQHSGSAINLINESKNIAEGLYARSEALGINKAVFATLGELKVGLF